MMIVVLKWRVKPGEREELTRSVHRMVSLTGSETGCLSCQVFNGSEDENSFTLVEEWENMADLDRHIHKGTFKTLFHLRNFMDGPPDFKVIPVSTRVRQDASVESCIRSDWKP
jgi:quinol monooxygenase YgiN